MNPDSVLKGVSSNVENILKSGSIFVFPSSVEGFPLALTEAMSMGLCCVGCCDCLSVSTLVKDDYSGILTQPNGKDLAEAIKKSNDNSLYEDQLRKECIFGYEKVFKRKGC